MNFPGEDGGRSLAEMAQRDLDAALQLLADRAQYITGAGGAAIALRREGKSDLLCRASAGANAPELGALLSTEFGLSGESVRTRKALRCDDAERDARVNREVCRELGIASVVVMPVVHDDDVLGVFELFSGKANAFGERDLTALERLSEMVETAVRMARAAESVSGSTSAPVAQVESQRAISEAVVTAEFVADLTAELGGEPVAAIPVVTVPAEAVDAERRPVVAAPVPAPVEVAPVANVAPVPAAAVAPAQSTPQARVETANSAMVAPNPVSPAPTASAPVSPSAPVSASAPEAKVEKRMLWSAAVQASEESSGTEGDRSHVPPVLRGLKKCEACGFPVSSGRSLCVECEEKKWRGQLKPRVASSATQSAAVAAAPALESSAKEIVSPPEDVAGKKDEAATISTTAPLSDFVLSAGLEPSQSWIARHKYMLVAIVLAAAVAVMVFLR